MDKGGIMEPPEYQVMLVKHAGKLLLVTSLITGVIPLALGKFDTAETAVFSPFAPSSYLTIIAILGPVCYALCTIVILRWLRSSEMIIKTASMSVFIITLVVGISVAYMLRPARFGGVVIDARQTPALITHDKALPAGIILIIRPDGSTEKFETGRVPNNLLESVLKAR